MTADRWLGLLWIAFVAAGCDPGACPEESTVLWVDVEPLFAEYCLGCHSSQLSGEARREAPEAYDYDTAAESRAHPNWTWAEIQLGHMPPSAPLLDQDQQQIREWLACGGPE